MQLWTKSSRCVFSKKSIEEFAGSEPCLSQLLPADDVQLEEKLCLFLAGRSLSISSRAQLALLHGASCRVPCETQTLLAGPQS